MSEDFFNDDYDGGKSALARGLSILFRSVLWLISAATSAAFFYLYAPNAFDFISPTLSPWISAIVGPIVFEVGSVVWPILQAQHADTDAQIEIAKWSGRLTAGAGLVVTVVYFMLSNSLISSILDDTAYTVVSIVGGTLIVAGIAGNFLAGFLYGTSGAAHKEAEHKAEQRARAAVARHEINTDTAKATLERTKQLIREQLAGQSAQQGAANARRYMDEYFTVRGNGNGRANGRPLSSDEPTPSWEQMIDFARRHPDLADQMAREARSRIGQNGHATD